jgi:hypothetical protein
MSYVKSQTGVDIYISSCPIICQSKLQDAISLSTMESEYNALITSLKEVLQVQYFVEVIGKTIELIKDLLTASRQTFQKTTLVP